MANLTQLKMLEDLNGFLLVDKPAGIAFSTVVKAVKRKFNLVKVGHGGSLDAMASGLLILLINDANKFVGDVMGADRVHEGVIRLGIRTDTHDIHGHELKRRPVPALSDADSLSQVAQKFQGDIFQTESPYCSVRKEGSAAYEVATTGEHKPFMTHVYRLRTAMKDAERIGFEVYATKSLLARTLAHDFGEALGCGGCLESLRRTQIGKWTVAEAIQFDKLLEREIKDFASCVMPLSKALR